MFQSANYIEAVDNAFLFIVVISALLFLAITFLMVYFVFKYNRKKVKKASNIEGNLSLEIAWTVIPVILVLAMFYFGWEGYQQLSNPPANAMVVKATGQMWKWTFEYDNGLKTDTLFVPQGKPVRVNLHSADVNHAFFIPAFRVKRDVIPNRTNFVWFNAQTPGAYDIECTQYCGLNHSAMLTKVVVLPQGRFSAWMSAQVANNKTAN